jgi:hypothetical protein
MGLLSRLVRVQVQGPVARLPVYHHTLQQVRYIHSMFRPLLLLAVTARPTHVRASSWACKVVEAL